VVLCVSFVNGDERACCLQQIHKHLATSLKP
jgi:hypothetical protein